LPAIDLSLLGLCIVPAARASAWLTNNPLAAARVVHTATLLQNGKVLVAGGNNGTNAINTAELYDPATGLWTPTGPLNTARSYHTATLLQNGKVLVAGGLNTNSLTSCELYDPLSGTWTLTGPLNVARSYSRATPLSDGEVLMTGGNDTTSDFTNTPTAELYNPATGSWTLTGNLHEGRSAHTATLLPDGRVLVAGGSGNLTDSSNVDPTLSSIEIYDPSLGTWTLSGSLTEKRSWQTATLLPNGLVMFAGGIDFNGTLTFPYLSTVELYDPIAGTNTLTAAMSTLRADHTATLLPNGRVLVTGGQTDSTGNLTNSVEVYDPVAGTWSLTNSLATARFLHTATLLPSGEILVTGGGTTTNPVTSTTELYDSTISPAAGTWTFTGSMQFRRRSFTMTLLPDGTVLVAAGENGNLTMLSSAELYNPITGIWTNTGSLNTARFHHAATLLPNGKVLVTGGIDSNLFGTTSAELYDPITGIWTTANPMNSPHLAHTATLLHNGKVLVAGDGLGHPNSAELYDWTTGTWTPTGNMITYRTYHKAVLLPNGKVLVVGGDHGTVNLSSAELYDPATGMWTAAGTTRAADEFSTAAVLLPSGHALVVGGDTNALPVADLFDPTTGSWTPAQPPKAIHYDPTFTLLSNGKGLLAGEGSSEIYDPATAQWTTTGNMNQYRYDQQSIELPDGRVLTAGGADSTSATTNAELYDIGLAFTNSSRPQILSVPSNLNLGTALTLTGSGFRGISEGSSGSTQASSTGHPLVRLKSLESSQTTFLLTTNWSTNSFTSLPVWNFPPGYALATVFVNGIQSTSSIVNISVPVPAMTTLSNAQSLPDGSFQFTFTNNPGAVFGILASTNLTLPLSNWTALSGITEIAPGEFQFKDPQATNSLQRFYELFTP
jgi:N-acetylneuraminic acid mutarotase